MRPSIFRPSLIRVLVLCAVACGCSGDAAARRQRFMEAGNEYFERSKFAEAVIEYRNALQIDDNFGEAHAKLATAYERLGDTRKAFAERIRAAELLPQDLDAQLAAGSYLLAAGRFDEAQARAQRVLSRDAQNIRAQVLLGNALAGLRDFDQAVAEIERAIALDPARAATYVNLGVIESVKGQQDAAQAALEKAVSIDEKWIPARLALANHFWATGRTKEAEDALRTALSIDPSNALSNQAMTLFLIGRSRTAEAEPFVRTLTTTGAAPLALADYYLVNGRTDEAIVELKRLRSQETSTSRFSDLIDHRLARASAIRQDWPAVHRTADDLLSRKPQDAEMLLIKGEALIRQGQRDEAAALLTRAAKVEGISATMRFALGQGFRAIGDHDQARKAYSEAIELNPRLARAQVELARLDLLGGEPDEAARRAKEAVRAAPNNLDARLMLARALMARSEIAAADEILKQTLADHPRSAQARVLRGMFFVSQRDAPSARQEFERALELDSRAVEAIGGLVSLDTMSGQIAKANERVQKALKEQGERPELLLIAASTQASAKSFDDAAATLRRAIQLDPGLLPAYLLLGQVYVAQGKVADATRELEIAAARQPKPVAAVTMLGLISQMRGDTAAARKHFERVLDLEPDAPIAANNLAWMYAEEGTNLDVALQLAQTAVRRLPKVASVQDTLGWVYYKKQASDQAIAAFTQTTAMDPQNATYHYHLGLALRQAGDAGRARESLDRALKLKPDFSGAADARRVLGELATSAPSDGRSGGER